MDRKHASMETETETLVLPRKRFLSCQSLRFYKSQYDLFSKLVVHVTNLSGDERSDARVCMTFVNSATLPFIFAPALFKEINNGLMMDVSSCLSFYLLAWSPAFCTYGRHLLLSHDSYGSSSSGGNIIRSNGHSQGGSGRLSDVNNYWFHSILAVTIIQPFVLMVDICF